MDLFDIESSHEIEELKQAPLALRMRPRTLEEFVGQKQILGEGMVLRRAILEDALQSVIFWGPPGSGKTALAYIIANVTKAHFIRMSAVTSNVSEVRKAISESHQRLKTSGRRTIILIDEIHRFNKAQQDALLPAVEEGTIILIGVTTENPYFEVNSPLISRSRIFRFEPLPDEDVRQILKRALEDRERGLGSLQIKLEKAALEHIIKVANGDARCALNALEMAALTTSPGGKGVRKVTLKIAEDAIQKRAVIYDREGDAHYDTISAFIKSMRGSDPDAAIYWLARMLYAGEDPRFIARRMVIFASEDIGNADPQALVVATAAAQAVEFVGLPECRLNLAQAAIYLATAPKSNSVIRGIDKALKDVEEERSFTIPKHLRDAHYPGAKKLGHGEGYKYPHSFPGHYVSQDYLPPELRNKKYYIPSSSGHEKKIAEYLKKLGKE
ncbi:MAG: AAA family ATPase [Actinomycetota bacterium]|nr:AAA family ATPase [Actinomycetota bacterium]MDI6821413.1 AAA family ATPase [Actinomycetota bacterium]